MASPTIATSRAVWRGPDDQLLRLAGENFLQSGYGSVSDRVDAIRQLNPHIVDWGSLAEGSIVLVPSLPATSGR